MNAHGTAARKDFLRFVETNKDTFTTRARSGALPFEPALSGCRRYGPADFLAIELQDALVDRGMPRGAAAQAVLASGAPEKFLAELSLGIDASDFYLVLWHEIEVGSGHFQSNRRSGMMTGSELAELCIAQTPPPQGRTWQRVTHDGARDDRHAVTIGVEGVVSLPITAHWRAAVERARRVGIDLTPGSVAVLPGAE